MFKGVTLMYSTVSDFSTSTSITGVSCNSLVCELARDERDSFDGGTGYKYQIVIPRLILKMSISLINFENSDTQFVNVQKFCTAPFRRVYYTTSATYPNINGFTDFNGTNVINLNVSDFSTNWENNKKFRNISLTFETQKPYAI